MKTISISLFAMIAATPALAQSLPDQPTTDAKGDTIVVTGTRSLVGQPVELSGSSVTIIDSAALQDRQTRVISDVLRDVPGLSVSRTGAAGGLTQVRMRGGEGNHTLVLVDGIEASDPFQGEFDFGGLVADDIARIEVLRGQQSAIYGSDAIGGVIHYITASGADQQGVSGRVEYGSFDTLSASARAGGVVDSFDYVVSAAYNRTDGYPVAVGGTRDIGAETVALSSKLNWKLTDNFSLHGVGRYARTEADTTGSSSTTFAPIDGTNNYRSRAYMGLLRAQLDLLEGRWANAATVQINDNRRISFGGATGNTRSSANEGQRRKASFDSTLKLGEDAALSTITFAADFEREEFRNLPPATPQPLSRTRRFSNRGLVGEYRFSSNDTFSIGAAIRNDHNSRFDNATTYRISGSYKIAEPLRIRAAAGSGIKNPTPFELFGFSNSTTVFVGNPNLKPEKSEGWEVGADLSFDSKRITFGATYFDSTLKNEIFSNRVGTASTPGNRVTDSKQHGVELTAAARIADVLKVDAAYTYLRSKENGLQEIRRPRQIASLNVTAMPVEPLSITATVRYNGEMIDSNFTTLPVGARPTLDAYTLVNLAAEWKLTQQIKLFGRVENLFDDNYTEVFGFNTPGRAGYVGVRAAF